MANDNQLGVEVVGLSDEEKSILKQQFQKEQGVRLIEISQRLFCYPLNGDLEKCFETIIYFLDDEPRLQLVERARC